MAATFITYPLREVLRVFRVFIIVLQQESSSLQDDMKELIIIARLWFPHDLKAVEHKLAISTNPFLRTGVQLVIDNAPLDDIVALLPCCLVALLQWRI
ncbi:MAG: hypothetical protein RRB22_07730 [Gammaproteobacteria bacterium]|nr:hypothetical protein [Gammaproteobacteria bacterium]